MYPGGSQSLGNKQMIKVDAKKKKKIILVYQKKKKKKKNLIKEKFIKMRKTELLV